MENQSLFWHYHQEKFHKSSNTSTNTLKLKPQNSNENNFTRTLNERHLSENGILKEVHYNISNDTKNKRYERNNDRHSLEVMREGGDARIAVKLSSKDKENKRLMKKIMAGSINDALSIKNHKHDWKKKGRVFSESSKENEPMNNKMNKKKHSKISMERNKLSLIKKNDNYRNEVETLLGKENDEYYYHNGEDGPSQYYSYMYQPEAKEPGYYYFDDDDEYYNMPTWGRNDSETESRLKMEEDIQREKDEMEEEKEEEGEEEEKDFEKELVTPSSEKQEGEEEEEEDIQEIKKGEKEEAVDDNIELDEVGFFDVSENCQRPEECPPRNGGWTEWSPWACPTVCDKGYYRRKRDCSDPPPLNGGENCVGDDTEWDPTRPCDMKECRNAPIPKGIKELIEDEINAEYNALEADEGGNVTIACSSEWIFIVLKMIPGSQLRWYHNERPLYLDGTRMWLNEEGISIKFLHAPDDNGEYACALEVPPFEKQILRISSLVVNSDRIHYQLTEGEMWSVACHSSMLANVFPSSHREWRINNNTIDDETLEKNDSQINWAENITIIEDHGGEWLCSVMTPNDSFTWRTNKFNVEVLPPPFPWWVLIIAVVALFLLVLYIVCCILYCISKKHLKTKKFVHKRGKIVLPDEGWQRYVCFEAPDGGWICIEDPDMSLDDSLTRADGVWVSVEPCQPIENRRLIDKKPRGGSDVITERKITVEEKALLNPKLTNWIVSAFKGGEGIAIKTPAKKPQKFLKKILRTSYLKHKRHFLPETEPLLREMKTNSPTQNSRVLLVNDFKKSQNQLRESQTEDGNIPSNKKTKFDGESLITICSKGSYRNNEADNLRSDNEEKERRNNKKRETNENKKSDKPKHEDQIRSGQSKEKLTNDLSDARNYVISRKTTSRSNSSNKISDEEYQGDVDADKTTSESEDKGGGSGRSPGGYDYCISSRSRTSRIYTPVCQDAPRARPVSTRLASMGVPLPGLAAAPREDSFNGDDDGYDCDTPPLHPAVFSPIPLMGLARSPMPPVLSRSDITLRNTNCCKKIEENITGKRVCEENEERRCDEECNRCNKPCVYACKCGRILSQNFHNSQIKKGKDSQPCRIEEKSMGFRSLQATNPANQSCKNNSLLNKKRNVSNSPSDCSRSPSPKCIEECCSPSSCSETSISPCGGSPRTSLSPCGGSHQSHCSNMRYRCKTELTKNSSNLEQSHSGCCCADRESLHCRTLQKFYVPRSSHTQIQDTSSTNKRRVQFKESGILAYYPDRGAAYTPYSISPGPSYDKVPDVDCLLAKCRDRNRYIITKSCHLDISKTSRESESRNGSPSKASSSEPEDEPSEKCKGDILKKSPQIVYPKTVRSSIPKRRKTPRDENICATQRPSRSEIAAMVEKTLQARISLNNRISDSAFSALKNTSSSHIPPPPPLPCSVRKPELNSAAVTVEAVKVRSCAGCDHNYKSPTESEMSSNECNISDDDADESTNDQSAKEKTARSGRSSVPLKSYSTNLLRKSTSFTKPKSGSYRGSMSYDSLPKQLDSLTPKDTPKETPKRTKKEEFRESTKTIYTNRNTDLSPIPKAESDFECMNKSESKANKTTSGYISDVTPRSNITLKSERSPKLNLSSRFEPARSSSTQKSYVELEESVQSKDSITSSDLEKEKKKQELLNLITMEETTDTDSELGRIFGKE